MRFVVATRLLTFLVQGVQSVVSGPRGKGAAAVSGLLKGWLETTACFPPDSECSLASANQTDLAPFAGSSSIKINSGS